MTTFLILATPSNGFFFMTQSIFSWSRHLVANLFLLPLSSPLECEVTYILPSPPNLDGLSDCLANRMGWVWQGAWAGPQKTGAFPSLSFGTHPLGFPNNYLRDAVSLRPPCLKAIWRHSRGHPSRAFLDKGKPSWVLRFSLLNLHTSGLGQCHMRQNNCPAEPCLNDWAHNHEA